MESRVQELEKKVAYLEKQLNLLQDIIFNQKKTSLPNDRSINSDETIDVRKFRKAFESLSKDSKEIPIHLIRKKLNWKDSFFDKMLQDLLDKDNIVLHRGDISTLNIRNLSDSFIDASGETFVNLSWKE